MLKLSTAARNAAANAIVGLINGSATNGIIEIYKGTAPANPETEPSSGNLLATLAFSDPAFAAASNGSVSADTITEANAVASGTATWARIRDSSGVAIIDLDVGLSGSVLNLNTTTIVSGSAVRIISATFTMPSGA